MQSTAPLTGSLIQSSNLDSSLASLHNSPFRSARKDSRHMSTASMGPGQQMENNGYAFLRCVPPFCFFSLAVGHAPSSLVSLHRCFRWQLLN
jgi:hypothetical protein